MSWLVWEAVQEKVVLVPFDMGGHCNITPFTCVESNL